MTIVKNFFVFLVLLLLISCEDTRPDCVCGKKEVKVTNLQSSDDRNAVFVSKQKLTLNRKPFTGKIIDCYENKWKSYSRDSSLIVKGHFKNHKQHGPICNYRNGLLWQKGTYINDHLEGPYYIYKKDGSVKTVIEFKKGIVKNCIGDCDEFNKGDDDYMMGYMVNYR
jgi:antitoxin component YwqK of YwqJK toxin-antitoxin module